MQDVAKGSGQAMGFGETLSAVFQNFARLFKPLLMPAIGFGVIIGIAELAMRDDMIRMEQGEWPGGGFISGMLLMLLGSTYFWVVGYQRAHSLTQSGQMGDEFTTAWKRLLPVLLFTILYALVSGFGMLLLVVPGIFLSVLFIVGDVQIAIGRAGIFSAFRESARLVWGNWWFSFGIVLIIAILIGIPYVFIEVGLEALRYEGTMGDAVLAGFISVLVFLVVYPLGISTFYTLLGSLEGRQGEE